LTQRNLFEGLAKIAELKKVKEKIKGESSELMQKLGNKLITDKK
jgi:hypothetical protein